MKVSMRRFLSCAAALGALLTVGQAEARRATQPQVGVTAQMLRSATPFQNNNGVLPPPGVYRGPLFRLNHAWPTRPPGPPHDAPWQAAIHDGRITPQNAAAYAAALKAAVAANGRALIMHYRTWDAAKAGWYNEPWLGSLREPIHGTYPAGEFGPGIFPGTGLRAQFNTHVLTYYDARAAASLSRFWGASAMHPALNTQSAQFAEGSIIVKAAIFASEDPAHPLGWWDAMNGAQVWDLFVDPTGQGGSPRLWKGYVAQFDIIVKDSQSAPDTGWVFMTRPRRSAGEIACRAQTTAPATTSPSMAW